MREFLHATFGSHTIWLRRLRPIDLERFITGRARHCQAGSAQVLASSLRSWLRYQLRRTETAFQRVRQRLGWEAWSNRPRPRLYDLRHHFACERLTCWHAAGRDVNLLLPALSTYLGHVKVTDTYWYLTGVPSLLAICAQRLERLAAPTRGGLR